MSGSRNRMLLVEDSTFPTNKNSFCQWLDTCGSNEATRMTVQKDYDAAMTMSHVSTAGLSIGLASAAVGVILFATGIPKMKKVGQMIGPNGITYRF